MSVMKKSDKPVYFAVEDKLEFLDIITKYKNIFEGRNILEYNIKSKKDIWTLIEKEYNEKSPITGKRTVEQLQCLYRNLKRKAKTDALREEERSKYLKELQINNNTTEPDGDICSMIYTEDTVNNENYQLFITSPDRNFYSTPQVELNQNICQILDEEIGNDQSYQLLIPPSDKNFETYPQLFRLPESAQNNLISKEILETQAVINKNDTGSTAPIKRLRKHFRENQTLSILKKRYLEEQHKLKLKILRTEFETKKKLASFNNKICELQQEVVLKKKETAMLEKKFKIEELQEQKLLLQLKRENEFLKHKILKLKLHRFQSQLNC